MKDIKIEADISEWDIRRWLTKGMTTKELTEFSYSLGFSLPLKEQRQYWRSLEKECKRLLEV